MLLVGYRARHAVPSMLTIASGDVSVVIDESMGGRLVSWRVAGIELLAGVGTSPVAYGMYPMAPWAGRLDDDTITFQGSTTRMPVTHEGRALHGLMLDSAMTMVERSADRVSLACALSYPWPWAGGVQVTWQVHPTGLDAAIEVTSDRGTFPAVAGWHPWFRRDLGRGDLLQWSFPDEGDLLMAERGVAHALTGRLVTVRPGDGPFDDAFRVPSRRVRLAWPDVLMLEASSSHDWFVVYDHQPEAVCIEPQSGPPNGVNASALSPVHVVTPDTPLRMSTAWSITADW